MPTIRENILNTLSADLMKIQSVNGYINSVKFVAQGLLPEQISMYPSIGYQVVGESRLGYLTENKDLEVRKIDIKIAVFTNEEQKETAIENMISDLNKLFKDDSSILTLYQSSINLIDGVWSDENNRCLNVNDINQINDAGIIIYDISVLYLSEYNGNSNGSSGLPVVPSVLSNYTVTSDFVTVSANLQEQINNIAISGANVWGTITGSLSAQTDIMNEFSKYATSGSLTNPNLNQYATTSSLTGYMLNSLSSGFSSSGHTHSVINNDLTVTGNIYCNTNAIYSNTFASNGYGQFTSNSSGAGMILNIGGTSPGGIILNTLGTIGSDKGIWLKSATHNTISANSNNIIGTTSITGTTNIYGNAKIGTDYSYLYLGSGTNNYIRVGNDSETSFYFESCNPRMLISAGGDFTVKERGYPSSTEWMIVKNTGTYINPKLTVSGDSIFTGKLITNGLTGYSGTITAGQTMVITNGLITSVI